MISTCGIVNNDDHQNHPKRTEAKHGSISVNVKVIFFSLVIAENNPMPILHSRMQQLSLTPKAW